MNTEKIAGRGNRHYAKGSELNHRITDRDPIKSSIQISRDGIQITLNTRIDILETALARYHYSKAGKLYKKSGITFYPPYMDLGDLLAKRGLRKAAVKAYRKAEFGEAQIHDHIVRNLRYS